MNLAKIKQTPKNIQAFIKNNFEITYTKRSFITASVFTVILLLLTIFSHKSFLKLETSFKWLLLSVSLILPFIVGATILFKVRIIKDKANKIWHMVFIFVMPLLTVTMSECLNSVFILNMKPLGLFANYLLILLLYFLFYAITGSLRVPVLVVNPIVFGLAVAHSYIMEFRGTPFLPMDFLAAKTAAGVAGTYNFSITAVVLIASMLFIIIMTVGIRIKTPCYHLSTKIISRVFMGAFFAIIMFIFYFTSWLANLGVAPDFWNQTRGYHNYGFSFMFFCNTKYLFVSEPEGYDAQKVPEYVDKFVDDNDEIITSTSAKTPHIICIMNESLSDLQVLGSFTTNEDYMPFMRSLKENTIRGNLYVPVIGAGTSNTEFEFITGHTTAFLPSGSNAYMLYINNPIASMVSTLKGQGYSSLALHPYYADGWNRVSVYNNLGFNNFFSLETILNADMMKIYRQNAANPDYLQMIAEQYYPGENLLLRQYVSDSYNYKVLIDDFENRDKSKPYFAFNVTMQNHGGYTTSCSNFDESIYVTSSQNTDLLKTNKYLSLVKYSDDAFKELIEYFEKVDEPTVICMFGDHHPTIETDFIEEVLGVNSLLTLDLEQEQARHATPFFIWANYDIEEREIERLSSNYLSSLVLKTAGVKLTEYNKYLLKLSELLPVIDTTGYIDHNGIYYSWNDDTEYRGILKEYERIQYNNIFDNNHTSFETFYLDDYRKILEEEKQAENQIDSAKINNTSTVS